MSLVVNSYLSDRSLKIRSKAIPWDVSHLISLYSHTMERIEAEKRGTEGTD